MPGGGTQERLQFRSRPCLLLHLWDRPQARGVRDERDVAYDDAAADGIGERAADDEMDLVHGLGRERRGAVVGCRSRS